MTDILERVIAGELCARCGGDGQILPAGTAGDEAVTCPECEGSGKSDSKQTGDDISVGTKVLWHFQDEFAAWVQEKGPGHTLLWLEQNLWPNLANVVNDVIRAERATQDAKAKQSKLKL